LTDAGRLRVDATFDDLVERERGLLGSLTSDDRRTLAGLLRSLLVPFDADPAN
jgi:hypothetical protein